MSSSGSVKKKPSKKSMLSLNDRQEIFVKQYPIHWNGTRAAREAGYANPDVDAARLLKIPAVQQAIAYEKQKLIERLGIDPAEVLFHIWCMATVNGGDFTDESGKIITDMNQLSLRAKNCIAGIEQTVVTRTFDDGSSESEMTTKLKLTNKNDAVNSLMKHKGLFEPSLLNPQENLQSLDWGKLYGRPKGVTDPDVIEIKKLEVEEK